MLSTDLAGQASYRAPRHLSARRAGRLPSRRSPNARVHDVLDRCDCLIVGAGLYGLTMAERIANASHRRVLLIDKRRHIGGNAHAEFDTATGIEVHRYGSHIFHTSNEKVWEYVRTFTNFNDYRHHVYALHQNMLYPMPISLPTISQFVGHCLTPQDARQYISGTGGCEGDPSTGGKSRVADTRRSISLEDRAVSLIGRPLYDAFIREYTRKQWQTDPKLLPGSIIARLPVRLNCDTRYFSDRYEGIPTAGYGAWFARMIDNPLIEVALGVDYFDIRQRLPDGLPVVYTGPIDRYFDYNCGRLSWRTLRFEVERLPIRDYQGNSVINHVDASPSFTRIHEFKHFHPERREQMELDQTIISREYSASAHRGSEEYYPVDTPSDHRVLGGYRAQSKHLNRVLISGRLGLYRYLDMHMVIAAALANFGSTVQAWWEK